MPKVRRSVLLLFQLRIVQILLIILWRRRRFCRRRPTLSLSFSPSARVLCACASNVSPDTNNTGAKTNFQRGTTEDQIGSVFEPVVVVPREQRKMCFGCVVKVCVPPPPTLCVRPIFISSKRHILLPQKKKVKKVSSSLMKRQKTHTHTHKHHHHHASSSALFLPNAKVAGSERERKREKRDVEPTPGRLRRDVFSTRAAGL